MPKQNNINGIHAQRLKSIRPFVNFDYDLRKPLTKSQKRTIKKYHDAIDKLQARPNKIYHPRSEKNKKEAQAFSQHPKGLPGIKVAFVPTANKDAKVTFGKDGRMILKTKHVATQDIRFDPVNLALNPKDEVKRAIQDHPRAKSFTIKADEHEIPISYDKATFSRGVIKLMDKYANADANNYFGNWLFGAKAHYFTDQTDFSEFQRSKDKAKKELQKKRRNKKRRNQRAKDK